MFGSIENNSDGICKIGLDVNMFNMLQVMLNNVNKNLEKKFVKIMDYNSKNLDKIVNI